ncbi:MAG TPA: S24 family peptidase, partial [Alphaproteobacteria bacterium]|nr:S24 family peptidase [Alphaproteobacteria bacterium]
TGNGDPISDVERPVAVWQVPREVLAPVTMAAADRIRIITTIGDSMEPSIPAGSKLMVDTSDCMPSPPGIFVVFDGIGLVVKRVEYVPHSEPARVRLWSDNPAYESYERPLTDANIRGRVIGRWRWM